MAEENPDVDPLVTLELHQHDTMSDDVIVDAIGIWFVLGEYSTLGNFPFSKGSRSTTDDEERSCSHFLQAAHVFLDPVQLRPHQWLQLRIRPHSGHVMYAQTMQGSDTVIEKHVLDR